MPLISKKVITGMETGKNTDMVMEKNRPILMVMAMKQILKQKVNSE